MLALTHPEARTGLTGRDLVAGCVAENSPRSLGQALRLVQSIRWFGGELADAQVVVCVVGEPDPGIRRELARYEAEVRFVAPFHPGSRADDKLQFFSEAAETDREMLLLLDCNTLVVQDPLPWIQRGAFQARIAPLPVVATEVFERIFRHYGLPRPARTYVNSVTGTPTIRHCSSSVILVPSALVHRIVPLWRDFNARLADEIEILHPSQRQCHPASLSLALAACPVPFAEVPAELDFQLDLFHFPAPEGIFAVDPAILRYEDQVDADGYFGHTPYPFAQVRIEAFNRRLRQEREGWFGRPRVLRASEKMMRESTAVPPPAAQVAVLGMHRSGTSALTGLLERMGLWAGEESDFPPADGHNEAGYWEHRGVWSVDEAILQTLDVSWSDVADFDLGRLEPGVRDRLRTRAREVVRELDRHGPWVVKDPRLCLLFPFWREILAHPFCVLLYREPLPVARSLAARDGFPLSFGIALWEKYTLEALAATQGLPRVLISHQELLADPAAVLARLHGDLLRFSPELAHLRVPAPEEIHEVLDPSLVHHPHEAEVERSYLTPPQTALLDALVDGSALDLDPLPPLSAGARDLLAAYENLLAANRRQHQRLATRRDLAAGVPRAQEELIAAHQRSLSWLEELDAIVSAIFASRSWKIGRAITSALGRLRGNGQQISAAERRERLMQEVRRWRTIDQED